MRSILVGMSATVYCLVVFAGCSGSMSKRAPTVNGEKREAAERAAMNWDVEYYSPKDLALQEVMKSPTQFPILHEEDYYVWERAKIFMTKYTKGVAWENEISGLHIMTSDAENNDESFHYQVSKRMTGEGYTYTVNCFTWDHQETPTSLLNAKTLSRFMRRGELEADLIVK